MRTPSFRAQSTPAQSMPAQMRCVWRSSSARHRIDADAAGYLEVHGLLTRRLRSSFDLLCRILFDEVDRAYGHEHLEAELVAAGAAPRS
eukprot:3000554-Prymnesium_polylepis.1